MKIIIVAFALIALVGADVSELSSKYLPPQVGGGAGPAPSQEYIPPQQGEEVGAGPEAPADIAEPAPGPGGVEGTEVGADGYRYKTVKRIRYRHRV